jgi:hypothetical protein
MDAILVAAQQQVEGAAIAALGRFDERRVVSRRSDAATLVGVSHPRR